ncbi:alpha/beta hydrolase [Enterococcus sp. LJL51]|uniref:alpha/beta hydrolase n=1 Tax=Enterococcus sp. LJL51 TaxID=3416656 RepID=UPI003CEAC147
MDNKSKQAILLIHGFGGDERELLHLYESLQERSAAVFTVRLAGHGGSRKEFSQSVYQEWLKSVEMKLDELETNYQQITLVGFSMGGLLAIQHSERQSIQQIIFCNTPMHLYNFSVMTSDILKGLLFKSERHRLLYYFSSAGNVSLRACLEFLKLWNLTKKKLRSSFPEEMKQKILILQNRRDETTHYKSADYILKCLDQKASIKLYDGGTHQMFESENKDQAVQDILTFLNV